MSRPLVLSLTEAAEADLASIWNYLASEASEDVANRLIARIEGACRSACQFPDSGPARAALAMGLRVTFEGRYAIYYTHDEVGLTVVRVLHGARDLAALVNRGTFT